MKKTMCYMILIICLSLGVIIYLQNEGFYMIEKSIKSDLQLINKNAKLVFIWHTAFERIY